MAATLPADLKISAAIVALSAPLREKYPRPTQIRTVIALTITAWNLALTTGDVKKQLESQLRDQLLANLSAEDLVLILTVVDTIIERKHRDYPDIHELIITYDLSQVDETMTLTVGTATLPPEHWANPE